MKAKEYFERFQTENQEHSAEWRLIHAFREMIFETKEIANQRNVKFDKGLIPIFNEMSLKANAFCKMVNETEPFKSEGAIKPNAFKMFINQTQPELFESVWGEYDESKL